MATTNSKPDKNVDAVVMGDDNKSFKSESKAINRDNKKVAANTKKDAEETFGAKKPWYKKLMFWKK